MGDGRLASLQILRAVAATLVFIFHLFDIFHLRGLIGSRYAMAGAAGVDIFFVVSGFIITLAAGSDRTTFMLKRIARIVPLYWLVTLAIFAVGLMTPQFLGRTRMTAEALLQSLFFIPFVRETGGIVPILPIGWTLNYEMMFYVLFAVCLGGSIRATVLRVSAILVTLVILGRITDSRAVAIVFYTDGIVLEFLFGMLICLVWRRKPDLFRRLRPLLPIGALMLLTQEMSLLRLPREIGYGLPAACILAGTLGLSLPDNRWSRIGVRIGDASYAMYLVHSYVQHLFAVMALAAGMTATMSVILVGSAAYLTTLIVSFALFHVVERPVLSAVRVWLSGRSMRHQSSTS
ncbi:acyltransferase [Tistrella mobilis]|uniref:acyltransferase family protein n=1 Tax=Tistrella mobilis TaxID=171437 RepID=UPI0035569F4F